MRLILYKFLNKTSASLFILALFLIGVYLFIAKFDFSKITHITAMQSIVLIGIAFFNLVAQGAIYKYSIKVFGINLSFKEWFGAINITLFANYIIPFSGFGFRAYYLKKKYKFSYIDFSSSLIAILLVEMFVFSSLGVIAFHLSEYSIWSNVFYMSLIIIMLSSALFFIPKFIELLEKVLGFLKLKIVLSGWVQFLKSGKELSGIFIYTIISVIFFILLFYISIYIITGLYDLKVAILMAVAGNLGMYLRITPAAIGTFEGGIVLIGFFFGIGMNECLLISICIRLAFLPLFFIFGPIYSWLFLGKLIPTKVN